MENCICVLAPHPALEDDGDDGDTSSAPRFQFAEISSSTAPYGRVTDLLQRFGELGGFKKIHDHILVGQSCPGRSTPNHRAHISVFVL
jgi:hypothetical protein